MGIPLKYLSNLLFIFIFSLNLVYSQSEPYQKGLEYFEKKDYQTAKRYFESHFVSQPEDEAGLESLGDAAAHLKEWDLAIACYQKIINLKSLARIYYKYGGAMALKAQENRLFALGHFIEIRNAFEEALSIDPSYVDAYWALVEYYIQLPVFLGGSKTKAKECANRLKEISAVDGFLALGHIAQHYKNASEAELAYKQAVITGGSLHTFRKLANFYEQENLKDLALQTWQKAYQKHQLPEVKKEVERLSKRE